MATNTQLAVVSNRLWLAEFKFTFVCYWDFASLACNVWQRMREQRTCSWQTYVVLHHVAPGIPYRQQPYQPEQLLQPNKQWHMLRCVAMPDSESISVLLIIIDRSVPQRVGSSTQLLQWHCITYTPASAPLYYTDGPGTVTSAWRTDYSELWNALSVFLFWITLSHCWDCSSDLFSFPFSSGSNIFFTVLDIVFKIISILVSVIAHPWFLFPF